MNSNSFVMNVGIIEYRLIGSNNMLFISIRVLMTSFYLMKVKGKK
ncbi:hypothetical protein HMPREF1568_2717 [Providencia alcalifaciens PAL-3]|nr:hypothetical protein HMPREF1568_2717 [Providencia alcalifaciens PAL-3]EUC98093.1 hypothetical protein HMPREF1566_2253 [Providencia alcalifaciens PAL-1]